MLMMINEFEDYFDKVDYHAKSLCLAIADLKREFARSAYENKESVQPEAVGGTVSPGWKECKKKIRTNALVESMIIVPCINCTCIVVIDIIALDEAIPVFCYECGSAIYIKKKGGKYMYKEVNNE